MRFQRSEKLLEIKVEKDVAASPDNSALKEQTGWLQMGTRFSERKVGTRSLLAQRSSGGVSYYKVKNNNYSMSGCTYFIIQ